MTVMKNVRRILIAVAAVTVSGCASAYHAYPDGCVSGGYCYAPPLPYTTYDACPTPVAECHAAGDQQIPRDAEPVVESPSED